MLKVGTLLLLILKPIHFICPALVIFVITVLFLYCTAALFLFIKKTFFNEKKYILPQVKPCASMSHFMGLQGYCTFQVGFLHLRNHLLFRAPQEFYRQEGSAPQRAPPPARLSATQENHASTCVPVVLGQGF